MPLRGEVPSILRRMARPEALYVLFIPIYLACFALVERAVPGDGFYHVSYLPLDDRIPFVECFVIPYCLWYPLLAGTGVFLLLADPAELRRYMRFLMLGFGFSLLFCLAVPNGQELRPEVFARDNLFTALLELIYAADTNTNVFPSMHVIGCGAVVWAAFGGGAALRRFRGGAAALCLLVCASTVLVKQHSVLDVIAGAAVSLLIGTLLYRKPPS